MATHPHLDLTDTPDLRSPLLVLAWGGWSDAGEAASHAARYLVATLDGEQFASIDPEEYYDFTETRPVARYRNEQREIVWPSTNFYAVRTPDLPRDLIVGVGVEPNYRWKSYMAAAAELIETMNVQLVVTFGAVAAPVPHTRPITVRGSANSTELAERYQMHPSRYEGPTGIVGVFHDLCRRNGVAGISLWASVSHYLPGIVNPYGARALLDKLSEVAGLHVDFRLLERETDRFHRQVGAAMDENDNLASYVSQLEQAHRSDESADDDAPEGPVELPTADGLIDELEDFLRESRQDES